MTPKCSAEKATAFCSGVDDESKCSAEKATAFCSGVDDDVLIKKRFFLVFVYWLIFSSERFLQYVLNLFIVNLNLN
jgi:hypothetical protein